MITRPVYQRKAPPDQTARPLDGLRLSVLTRFRPPPPVTPIDPTNPATARRR